MTEELIFEDPPGAVRGAASGVGPWLVTLRDHPGQWAKFPKRVHANTPTFIARGRYAGVGPGEFEAVGRNIGDSKADLYARYIGGES